MLRVASRVLLLLLAVVVLVAAIAFARAAGLKSRQPEVATPAEQPALDEVAILDHLSEALRFRTVSLQDRERIDDQAFIAFQSWLEATYPRVHESLEHESVGRHALLYRWPGSRPELAPLLLMAHQDVVPVLAESAGDWPQAPFSGARADGYVWGRGALDDKGPLIAILEAVEQLLAAGHRPPRTVLLAFGADEEIGGTEGAQRVAELLAERGVSPALVLDEGGALTRGMLPIERPVAIIGVAEKGYATVRITARGMGGHSSMPPRDGAVTRLAEALVRLRDRPFPAELSGPTAEMFETLAPELGLGARLAVANRWLTGPLLLRFLESDPTTAAMLHTTIAPTMLAASDKDNVLPVSASAAVNFRIGPGDSVAAVLEHVRRAVGPDLEVELDQEFSSEPSPVSPTDSEAFAVLARTVREIVPDAVVTPYLVVGGTDARYMTRLTPFVYRFGPLRIDAGETERVHGTGERVAEDAVVQGVRFYSRLIENVGSAALDEGSGSS